VLDNLVSNAIKFTPERGSLRVALAERNGEAVLSVADSGIGISDEDRERLFERFFRAGNALERAIPGTGLGLVICKGIVDAHHGRLDVRSRLGEGTTVTMALPLVGANDQGDGE
jgi:signal transduction histidine kinase